jgi:HEAT repeat protein
MMALNDTTGNEHDITKLFVYATEAKTPDNPQSDRPARVDPVSRYQDPSDEGPSPERLLAIERVVGLEDQGVVDTLETALRSDADPAVRRRAAVALEDIGGDPVVNALEAGLGDDDPSIRIAVANSLGRIGSERAIMAIGQTIIGDPDPETRRAAVLALEGHEGGAVNAFLKAAQKDRTGLVREAAGLILNR